jgi:hypothetical protein
MMLGKWQLWQPLKEMQGKYFIKSYCDNFDDLIFILSKDNANKDTELHVTFVTGCEIYRKTNESYRLRLWTYLDNTHSNLDREKSLYIVEDSEYLHYLSDESGTITEYAKFQHYCIMDSEWVFDVASQRTPRVELFVDGKLIESSEARMS